MIECRVPEGCEQVGFATICFVFVVPAAVFVFVCLAIALVVPHVLESE